MKLKKSVKRVLIIAIILILSGVGFLVYEEFKPKEAKRVKVVNEIKEYGYTLKDNKSARYKKMFQELKDILSKKEVDEEAYVKKISEMFILDFYTLNDKLANTDIGGIDFVNSNSKANFLNKAEDTMYKYVESNIYGNRKQSLPVVDEITIKDVQKIDYALLDNNVEAYQVDVSSTYKKDMDYQDKATLIFVHEDKVLSLVEIK